MYRTFVTLLLAASASTASARAVPPIDIDLPPVASHFAQPPVAVAPRPYRVLDRASVHAALAHARDQNLAHFRAYQIRGVFPSNTFSDGKLNVWRDADGHLCAAATIISASGLHDLVMRTAEQNNFIRLADVRQGPLMDWILTSGFTQEEIAAIQEPFLPDRGGEHDRLLAKYSSVTAMLVANESNSLDVATDRLMKNRQLAARLVAAR